MLQQINITSAPNQHFVATLTINNNPVTLTFDLRFSEMANAWYINISDAQGNLLLASCPLLTGTYPAANILGQYGYLGIGSSYILNTGNTQNQQLVNSRMQDNPLATDLGVNFLWIWGDQPTISIGAVTTLASQPPGGGGGGGGVPSQQPIYGGVGAPGATSSVTLSGSTVILSTGDVLGQLQSAPEVVGQSWSFSPNNQCVYLLLVGGSHTFVDAGSGFSYAFNGALTVNLSGRMLHLYQSTNTLFGSSTPKVAS